MRRIIVDDGRAWILPPRLEAERLEESAWTAGMALLFFGGLFTTLAFLHPVARLVGVQAAVDPDPDTILFLFGVLLFLFGSFWLEYVGPYVERRCRARPVGWNRNRK